jgi:hypothetical protein
VDRAWRDHLEALERFNLWETERRRRRPADYARSLEWLSEAWELADRFGSADPVGRSELRIQEVLRLRHALERARLNP